MRSDAFRQAVADLRAEGWLDWHILLAIAGITANHRAGPMRGPQDFDKHKRIVIEALERDETEDELEVPLDRFGVHALRSQIDLNMLTVMTRWGLRCNQQTPHVEAIKGLLVERYGYLTDDVDHDEPFEGLRP
jgi:hypothetical protein